MNVFVSRECLVRHNLSKQESVSGFSFQHPALETNSE